VRTRAVATARPGNGDLHHSRLCWVGDEVMEVGSAPVAERAPGPARENRGELRGQRWGDLTDEVDASVQAPEPPVGDSMLQEPGAEAKALELRRGDHLMLAAGDPPQLSIPNVTSARAREIAVTFGPHTGHNPTTDPARPRLM
jgi:hypothetical protein